MVVLQRKKSENFKGKGNSVLRLKRNYRLNNLWSNLLNGKFQTWLSSYTSLKAGVTCDWSWWKEGADTGDVTQAIKTLTSEKLTVQVEPF